MSYPYPTIEEFKTFFTRDFPYDADPAEGVTDTDIANAFVHANAVIQQGFFTTAPSWRMGYLYLAAHYLVTSINTSGLGLAAFGSTGFATSQSVGSVSQSFQIPEAYLSNPLFAALAGTRYGQTYFQMIYPNLIGNMGIARGRTLP